MRDRAANLLGAVGLAVIDRIELAACEVLGRAGETPAALVVIGYGTGPSNDQLRRILGLSHPGAVRLVDRLVADGLAERRQGRDRRAITLHLTAAGETLREELLLERLAIVRSLLSSLTDEEVDVFAGLSAKILSALGTTDLARRKLCRLCDDRKCADCPIPVAKPQYHVQLCGEDRSGGK